MRNRKEKKKKKREDAFFSFRMAGIGGSINSHGVEMGRASPRCVIASHSKKKYRRKGIKHQKILVS